MIKKHNIPAYLIPSVAESGSLVVGNQETSGQVVLQDWQIAENYTKYKSGVHIPFNCCEISAEQGQFKLVARDIYANAEKCYINADRNLQFKKDDIVQLPFGKYMIIEADNAREREIKNGFVKEYTTINIAMIKLEQ